MIVTQETGGGVLLCVNEDLNPTEYNADTVYSEQVWCQIGNLLVCVCYRSPNSAIVGHDNETNLTKVLREVCYKHVLITGDFNHPSIDWTTLTATQFSS